MLEVAACCLAFAALVVGAGVVHGAGDPGTLAAGLVLVAAAYGAIS